MLEYTVIEMLAIIGSSMLIGGLIASKDFRNKFF